MNISNLMVVVEAAVVMASFGLGLYLLFQFTASIKANQSVARWVPLWIAGGLTTMFAWAILFREADLEQSLNGGLSLMLVGDVLWAVAICLCRRAGKASRKSSVFDAPHDDQ